jgi:hypothetical protein
MRIGSDLGSGSDNIAPRRRDLSGRKRASAAIQSSLTQAEHLLFRRMRQRAVKARRALPRYGLASIVMARRTRGKFRFVGSLALLLVMMGCATAPMEQGGTLASYDKLTPSDGLLAHSRLWVDKDDILAAKTARIVPTAFTDTTGAALSAKQRGLLANAVDRSLCLGLSERFEVVSSDQTADLTVHAVVTHLAPTNPTAAGVSKVASLAPKILLPGVPVPVPRLPIGLGSLTLEGEARDRNGAEKAAMIWARGANSFTDAPRMSSDGDAYNLATSFGGDFSKLLVTGSSPFGKPPSLPSAQSIAVFMGGKPKNVACEAFGRDPGVLGLVAGSVGAPPDWTDKGAAPSLGQTASSLAKTQ